MRNILIYICVLIMNFVLHAQEQAYGTLTKCETCNTSSYLGTYKYVKVKSRISKKGEINNWLPINNDDFYYDNTIVFETNRFKRSPSTSHAIIVENPIYTIDKYRLENRGNPYFETDRFWRKKLSYYSKILDNYNDYTYLISIRKKHINDGVGEYISGDYFFEIYGDKLILSTNKKFYLLEKVEGVTTPQITDFITAPVAKHSNISQADGTYKIGVGWNPAVIAENTVHIKVINTNTGAVIDEADVENNGFFKFADRAYEVGTFKLSITATNAEDNLTFSTSH